MTTEDDEIIQEFLVESHENLDQLDRELVDLEQHPRSHELLSSIFRTIHTIKGTSGFLAFSRLETLTHAGENLLSRLRDGEMVMTPATADALLSMVDCVRLLLAAIEHTGGDDDPSIDVEPVITVIRASLDADPAVSASTPVAEPEPTAAETVPEPPAPVAVAPAATPAATPTATPVPAPAAATAPPASAATDESDEPRRMATDSTVRVDVDLLDTLVRLVGELVLTRNQILQQADSSVAIELVRASQRLDLVASELQENVMRTRMQPIANVWSKLPRVVRDLGAQLGRQVRVEMEGQETELDRTLLEAVKDPLTHLVRNAIDHGIEDGPTRLAAGKPEVGTLSLKAFHESGQVIVEISDDGAGIDPAVIAGVALNRGVVSAEGLARMDSKQIVDLIFRPGFSTAAAVTNVSGRGVGMDVVRTRIERVGGTVDLTSTPGLGTTFRVRIPLTLAIIPALVVEEAGERYAIPQANLVELVRLDRGDLSNVETLAGAPVLRLRGRLLPLVSMASELGVPESQTEAITVVVVQAEDARFGLCVAEVHDVQEIVVKPLGRQMKSIPLYAGATIMGDGRVALILDVAGLAHAAGVTAPVVKQPAAHDGSAETATLLLLDVAGDRRAALPLARVSRLEEFDPSRIERSGSVEVVQYRDGILPLVRLAGAIGLTDTSPDPDPLPVVVHENGEDRIGIVVSRVVDVVEMAVTATSVGRRAGVLGSAVVLDRVTELVDLDAVVELLNRELV